MSCLLKTGNRTGIFRLFINDGKSKEGLLKMSNRKVIRVQRDNKNKKSVKLNNFKTLLFNGVEKN